MMEVPYHYQFRIIVIGDTMVGKSSLLKTFSEGTFGEMEPTVGVDFFSKIIEIKPKALNSNNNSDHHNSSYNNHQSYRTNNSRFNASLASNSYNYTTDNNKLDESIIVKLQIWDTAGQERFKSIVTSYYRNSVGIVLVYDVTNRESYEHLIDWFSEARQHVEPSTPSTSPTLSQITHHHHQQQSPKFTYPITSTPTKQSSNPHDNTVKSNNSFNNKSKSNHNHGGDHHHNSTTHNNSPSTSTAMNSTVLNPLDDSHYNRQQQQPKLENHKMAYLVLGCKTDLESERQVSYEDGRAFADMYGFKFIETSSKTNYNVNQAFQVLAEEIYDKISECGRLNKLHRTASGGHITFDGTSSQINEGIRLGPLLESNSRRFGVGVGGNSSRVQLLEAQPVSGYLGGCC